jgi:small-conductance mechanosensitive channel
MVLWGVALWVAMLCVAMLGGGLPSRSAVAQESPTSGESDRALEAAETAGDVLPVEAEPQLIRPVDLAAQATEVSAVLDGFESTLRPDPEITQIVANFSVDGLAMADLSAKLTELDADSVTTRQLTDQRRNWNLFAQQFNRWDQRVEQRWRELQSIREELLRIRQSWELTRDNASLEELPAELRQRTDQILARVTTAQAEVRDRIEQIAEVIRKLTDAQQLATGSLRQVNELEDRIEARLFEQDSSSLWMVADHRWRAIGDSTWPILQKSVRDLGAFTRAQWPRILMHLFLIAALLIITLQARVASRCWPLDDAELDRARELLERPYSLSIALSIIPAILLYGSLPATVSDLFFLALLISVLRHVRPLTHDGERIVFVGLLILSAVHQMLFLTATGSLLARLVMLGIEVGVLLIVGRVLWRIFSRHDGLVDWRRVAVGCVGIAIALVSLVAIAANVLGWVNLSLFLGESTLLTCRGFLLLVALVRAWSGLWAAILRRGPGRRLLSVRRREAAYQRVGVAVLAVPLGLYWLHQSLHRFRLLELVESQVAAVLQTPLSQAAGGLRVGDVVRAMVILAATVMVQKLLGFLLNQEFFPRLRFGASSTVVWATLIKYAIVGGGLAMAASAVGFSGTQMTVVFGALGVGIGLGLQDIVSNFIAGLILMFERPVKIGDIVELGGAWGKVKNIGIRATLVETFEGSELLIPNRDLIVKEVKNWTLSGTTARVEILIGTAYDSNPREVLEILLRTAREHEFVLKEPEPFAMMFGFGDSALNFRMFCHTSMDHRGLVISDLHIAVLEALRTAGIEIPFPQRDLQLSLVGKTEID